MNKKWLMVIMLVSMFTTVQSFAQEVKEPKGDKPKREDMFTKLDSDADGKLSKVEIEKSDKKFLKVNFAEIDTNKDSFVNRDELKAYREKRKAEKKDKTE